MMLTFTRLCCVSSLALVAVVTAACGDSKSANPVAPSAIVVDAQQSSEAGGDAGEWGTTGKPENPGNGKGNGNGGNGNGNGGGEKDKDNGNGNGNGKNDPPTNTTPSTPTPTPTPTNTTPTTTRKVEIEGLIASKSGDAITVNAQSVTVPTNCVIRHGNTQFQFSDLKVGDRVHVKGMRTTTGSGSTATTKIEAAEVKLQNAGSGESEEEEDPTDLVSVTAFDALASETAGDNGTFRLTRAGGATLLASSLTVTFTLTGTATNGTDYTTLPLTATFPANQATVDVVVAPLADATTEGAETVILTLTGVGAYDLGSPSTATVTITDTTNPIVTVSAFDSTASETGPDLGTFRFTRTGSTTSSLTVTFDVTGTATNGTDYQGVLTTVTFAAGQATVDLFIVPFTDGTTEGSETVIVTVTDGATYDLGAPATATVTIAG
jgi:hypothetical protein